MTKTNSGLIEYCKAQVGLPYWYGTYGQTASEDLLKYKKFQYPKFYRYPLREFKEQFGMRVHDCAGLIKGYLWSNSPTAPVKYDPITDFNASGFYNRAKIKGSIASFPKVNGMLVFKGNKSEKYHVGVYCDGKVIEAKGHAYGVVITDFKTGGWKYWAQCHLIINDIKSNEDIAKEVIEGKWGNTPTRKKLLEAAGYVYSDIQSLVNKLLKKGE